MLSMLSGPFLISLISGFPCLAFFASMRFSGLSVYTCYWSPGGSIDLFERFLAGLETNMRTRLCPNVSLIVAGDFNARSPLWGSEIGDACSWILERFTVTHSLWPENVGSIPIFAVGNHSTVVDMTLTHLQKGSFIRDWWIRDNIFSDSDHRYVQYPLSTSTMTTNRKSVTDGLSCPQIWPSQAWNYTQKRCYDWGSDIWTWWWRWSGSKLDRRLPYDRLTCGDADAR